MTFLRKQPKEGPLDVTYSLRDLQFEPKQIATKMNFAGCIPLSMSYDMSKV